MKSRATGPRPQRGVTLVETLVYVAVSAIVLAILTMALRNMNKGFIQGAQTVRMQQGAREAVNLMAREIRNAGLKHAFYKNGSNLQDTLLSEASLLPGDSSSFDYLDAGRYDRITVRQARFDAAGAPLGVDTVTYQVDSTRQMLRRKLNDGAFEDFCAGIDALQFQYGVYAQRTVLVNERPPVAADWSASGSITLAFTPTRMVLSTSASGQGTARNDAVTFPINGSKTYYLEAVAAGDAGFFANRGLLQAELVDARGNVLHAEPFLPGRSMMLRNLALSAPTAAASRIAIRLSANGPASVRFASVRFGQADLGAYQWKDAPTLAEKKTVRAVRLMLMAKSEGQGAVKPAASYTIGNAQVRVNDKLLRRYFEEEIPILNNGVF